MSNNLLLDGIMQYSRVEQSYGHDLMLNILNKGGLREHVYLI